MSFGRWGNVSGAVLCAPALEDRVGVTGDASDRVLVGTVGLARLLDDLFAETLRVEGDPDPDAPGRSVPAAAGSACTLRGLVAALDAATSERVIVLGSNAPGVTVDLLLALAAWPEADGIVFGSGEKADSLCAIYRREIASSIARKRVAEGNLSLGEFHDALGAECVSLAELGLADSGDDRSLEGVSTGPTVSVEAC